MSENLYAAPQTAITEAVNMASLGVAFQDAGILYVRAGFVAPPVCVQSGINIDPSTKKYKIHISYINPLAYLLILIGLPGWIILACIQKNLQLRVHLSEENAKKFKKNKLIGWSSFLISLLLAATAIYLELPAVGLASAAIFIFCLIWVIVTNKVLRVIRHKNNFFELARAHTNFLAHIPQSSTPTTAIKFTTPPALPPKPSPPQL